MLEQVREAIDRHSMLQTGDHLIVAVSGGPDSVALLHLLHRLAPAWSLRLHVFHLDHGLRGAESAADARYVSELAQGLGHPVSVVRLAPGELKGKPGSLQANARRRRYQAIRELAARVGATKVATGHHRDDQAETVLMRLLRGAGLKGLAGIPPIRSEGNLTLIRPMLTIPRKQIELYCAEHKLFPRLDASNAQADYLRNRVRLELLPLLAQSYNPAIEANLAQLAELVREEDALLERLARQAFDRCRTAPPSLEETHPVPAVELDGARLREEPLALARRVVRLAARAVLGPEADLGLPAVTRVLDLAGEPHGSHLADLPGGLRLTVEYGRCRLEPQPDQTPDTYRVWPVAPRGETAIPELGLVILAELLPPEAMPAHPAPGEIWLDADRLPGPLCIRFRQPGDRIWPTGMEGSKKLQDILVDAKVPRAQRERLPLLGAGDQVLWVLGHRQDRRFLAGAATVRPLRLRILPIPPDPV
ncbi:MAG: tRNA lysidine(34) synthetase TilS [Bacillota bacterium]